jgi:type II secretory pathway pseudopilin PulG
VDGWAHARAEDGISLVEMLVVIFVLTFIMGGILTSALTANRLGVRDSETAQAVSAAQTAAYRMTVDLRQAIQIMPTGAAAGTCPAASTASCIDFLVRSRTIDPTTQNHWVRRIRLDCTQPYVAAGDPYASTYRSCVRYVSTDVADPGTPAPATIRSGVVLSRVLNWTTGTCASVDATFTCPIFAYFKSDATSSTGWNTANPSTGAERINVVLQVPSRGEAYSVGASRSLLVQDSAQLRNALR